MLSRLILTNYLKLASDWLRFDPFSSHVQDSLGERRAFAAFMSLLLVENISGIYLYISWGGHFVRGRGDPKHRIISHGLSTVGWLVGCLNSGAPTLVIWHRLLKDGYFHRTSSEHRFYSQKNV